MATRRRTRHPLPITPGKKLTYRDYAKLPDDGMRYEVLDGELHVTPAPVPKHQRVTQHLQFLLIVELEQKGLGRVYLAPIDVLLGKYRIVQPDILFIRKEHLAIVGPKNIRGAPDLIVEVLSPRTRRVDLTRKKPIYARSGVPCYWVVDPIVDRVELYRLEGERYVLEAQVERPDIAEPRDFPGLRIPLDEVFAE